MAWRASNVQKDHAMASKPLPEKHETRTTRPLHTTVAGLHHADVSSSNHAPYMHPAAHAWDFVAECAVCTHGNAAAVRLLIMLGLITVRSECWTAYLRVCSYSPTSTDAPRNVSLQVSNVNTSLEMSTPHSSLQHLSRMSSDRLGVESWPCTQQSSNVAAPPVCI